MEGVIVIVGFMIVIRRLGVMSMCMGMLILFVVIVLVVDMRVVWSVRCDGLVCFYHLEGRWMR